MKRTPAGTRIGATAVLINELDLSTRGRTFHRRCWWHGPREPCDGVVNTRRTASSGNQSNVDRTALYRCPRRGGRRLPARAWLPFFRSAHRR
jgi:hypothetical protein